MENYFTRVSSCVHWRPPTERIQGPFWRLVKRSHVRPLSDILLWKQPRVGFSADPNSPGVSRVTDGRSSSAPFCFLYPGGFSRSPTNINIDTCAQYAYFINGWSTAASTG